MSFPVYKMSDREYERIVEKMRERNRTRAQAAMANAIKPWKNEKTAKTARETGLCPATIAKYRSGKWGKRGPMLTTYLALIPYQDRLRVIRGGKP